MRQRFWFFISGLPQLVAELRDFGSCCTMPTGFHSSFTGITRERVLVSSIHLTWLGIHWLDLAMYVTGSRITHVAGFSGNVGGQPIDTEDSAAISLRFG